MSFSRKKKAIIRIEVGTKHVSLEDSVYISNQHDYDSVISADEAIYTSRRDNTTVGGKTLDDEWYEDI